jgi:uncharacterized membrane protein
MTTKLSGWLIPVTSLTFLGLLDYLWLSLMSNVFHRHFIQLQPTMKGRGMNIAAIILTYVVLFTAAYTFIILQIQVQFNKSLQTSMRCCAVRVEDVFKAGILGLSISGVYHLTNKATLQNYSWTIVLVDTAYGTVAMILVYFFAIFVAKSML